MEYVYFVFLIVFVVVGFRVIADEPFAGLIMLIIAGLLIFVPYANHNSNLATIEFSNQIIKVKTDYKSSLKQQLESLPSVEGAILNADSPCSQMVKEIASVEREVMQANQNVLYAEISIKKRERFATAFVLWFF